MTFAPKMPFTGERVSLLLALLNIICIATYLSLVSHGGWKIAAEQAQGIDVTTGEPFLWALGALPLYALFLLIDAVWAVFILRRRRWSGSLLWLLSCALWTLAILTDFAHH